MKNWVLHILILLLFSGCTMRPFGVLSQDKMVDVLLDVHIVEAAIQTLDSNSKRIEKQEYYNEMFAKHGITKEQFDKSLDWYSHHPNRFVEIYEEVKVRAEDLKTRIEAYEFHLDEKPTRQDSIAEFDLWHWERDRLLVMNADSTISIDSLHFSITDTAYFYRSEMLRFYLKMRVYAPDTVPFVTRMICHYSDSIVDTLQYASKSDSICRRYYFTQVISSHHDVDSVFVELIDSARTIESVQIDSVKLIRVYDKFTYPLALDVRNEIRSANDSISKEKKKRLEAIELKKNKSKKINEAANSSK